MQKHFLTLMLFLFSCSVHADEVLLSNQTPKFNTQELPALLIGKELFSMAEPGDTARYSAMITPAALDIGFNIFLRKKVLTQHCTRNTVFALLNWIGGTALLGWGAGTTVASLQKKIECFTQLYHLSCHPNLARLLQTYNLDQLPSSKMRNEFMLLQQSQFLQDPDANHHAQLFITDQLKSLAKSIYRLRTIGTALFSGTLAHLVSAGFSHSWSDRKKSKDSQK